MCSISFVLRYVEPVVWPGGLAGDAVNRSQFSDLRSAVTNQRAARYSCGWLLRLDLFLFENMHNFAPRFTDRFDQWFEAQRCGIAMNF